ncbi:LmbE-like protein [Mycena maculata]|uniref:N-acetylglucosaminylphosphatidylinositol deacetylase n=1 Tax=Mycena maculata TaxID=230809 RepID=A0AAD7JN82_9AGAR|nr:LmbE-like protein [Mycena maculata]
MLTTQRILLLLLPLIAGSLLRPRTKHTFGTALAGHKERTLLLTAHPDDETFFFSPTLTALSYSSMHGLGDIFVVSLSTGNAKGLGDARREEFGRALEIFGIREERRSILDHPYLQDNKTSAWDPAVIAEEIHPLVVEHNITTILTFDSHGITGHPNHRSALAGAVHLISSTLLLSPSTVCPRLFTLYSRPSTKHLGPLAAFVAPGYISSPGPVFVASLVDYVTALRAMSKHPSQLRLIPFMKGLFSRYLWVNEWVEVTM